MRENLTQAIEDYLKAIYDVTFKEGRASTTHLANYLEVTPASVTGMIQKLSQTEPPLVEYQKHHGVTLTHAGEQIALETIRHHRLLELFLHRILGYPWDEVHDEADRLEHVISEQFEDRIAIALGDPIHDPHGDPIPRKDLTIPEVTAITMSGLHIGQQAVIKRVRDTDPDLLRYLSELGVVPDAHVQVIDYSEFDDNLHLEVEGNNKMVVLGPRITDQIFIEVV